MEMQYNQNNIGYELSRFISEVKIELICELCRCVLRDPVCCSCTSPAAHFCRNCIQRYNFTQTQAKCPIHDSKLFKPYDFPRDLRDELKQLLIRCDSYPRCSQSILLADINSHNEVCIFAYVKCKHVGCPAYELRDSKILRNFAQDHFVQCQYRIESCRLKCGDKMEFKDLEDHERAQCHNRLIDCQSCHQKVIAKFFKPHQSEECPKSLIKCDICREKIIREQLQDHIEKNVAKHLLILNKHVRSQVEPTFISSIGNNEFILLRSNKVRWEFIFPTKENDIINSQKFVIPGGCAFMLQVSVKKQQIGLYFILYPGPFDNSLIWPFNKRVHLHLLEQNQTNSFFGAMISRNRFQCIGMPSDEEMKEKDYKLGFNNIISVTDCYNKCRTVDGKLIFEAIIEDNLVELSFNTATFTLSNINNFLLQNLKITSPVFVCNQGYSFRLEFSKEDEDRIRVCVQFMEGANDSHQAWPFNGTIELKIKHHFTNITYPLQSTERKSNETKDSTYEKFIFEFNKEIIEQLQADDFVCDNSMEFECRILPSMTSYQS